MRSIYFYILFVILVSFVSCSEDDGARQRLEKAREYFKQGRYELVIQEVDSIKALYPSAISERKAAVSLLDSARRGENNKIIYNCDSLITIYQPKVEEAKRSFVYKINKQYQDIGAYIPKEFSSDLVSSTTLRSGVLETGEFFIESVFVGSQKHNKLKVSTKSGSFAETLSVTEDGLNYRYSNMGKTYEIIRFSELDENNVGEFINTNSKDNIIVTLEGGGKTSYSLSSHSKAAIIKSYQLSLMMHHLDSLKTEKEKAQFKIYNLDNK